MHTGQVTVGTSAVKAIVSFLGLILLAALAVGMSIAAFAQAGAASWKGWGGAGAAVFILFGAVFVVVPLFRRQELKVTREVLAVSSRRKGRHSIEIGVRWADVEHVVLHRTSNGETSRDDIRVVLTPRAHARWHARFPEGYIELPAGFALSKKNLTLLLQRVHVNCRGRVR